MARLAFRFFNILVSLVFIFPWITQPIKLIQAQTPSDEDVSTGLYRASLTIKNDSARNRLVTMGVRVIKEGEGWAQVMLITRPAPWPSITLSPGVRVMKSSSQPPVRVCPG